MTTMANMSGRGVYQYKETVHDTGNAMPDKPKAPVGPQVKADKSQSGGGYKKSAGKSDK